MVDNASGKLRTETKRLEKLEGEMIEAKRNRDDELIKKLQGKIMTTKFGINFYKDQLDRGLST